MLIQSSSPFPPIPGRLLEPKLLIDQRTPPGRDSGSSFISSWVVYFLACEFSSALNGCVLSFLLHFSSVWRIRSLVRKACPEQPQKKFALYICGATVMLVPPIISLLSGSLHPGFFSSLFNS